MERRESPPGKTGVSPVSHLLVIPKMGMPTKYFRPACPFPQAVFHVERFMTTAMAGLTSIRCPTLFPNDTFALLQHE